MATYFTSSFEIFYLEKVYISVNVTEIKNWKGINIS